MMSKEQHINYWINTAQYEICTKAFTLEQLEKVKAIRTCLLKMMQ